MPLELLISNPDDNQRISKEEENTFILQVAQRFTSVAVKMAE